MPAATTAALAAMSSGLRRYLRVTCASIWRRIAVRRYSGSVRAGGVSNWVMAGPLGWLC
jgi:hypothetical protein